MSRMLSWVLVLAVLLCAMGSIDVPALYLPQASGDGHISIQGVCSAPPSLLSALCDRYPALLRVPELIHRSEKLVEAWMPDITLPFSVERGSVIDSIIVKAAPHFL